MVKKKHPTHKTGRKSKSRLNGINVPSIKLPTFSNFKTGEILNRFKKIDIKELKKINRNTALAAVLTLVLAVVGIGSIAFTNSNEEVPLSNIPAEVVVEEEIVKSLEATVLVTEGTLQIKSEGSDWKNIKSDDKLVEGVSLKTVGATSRASIGFVSGSELRIAPNSEIEFLTLGEDRTVIRHLSGYTYSRVKASESNSFVVTSSDAQYEANGTAFRTAATGDEQSVEVYHSSVVETSSNKTVNEGEKLTVKDSRNPANDGTTSRLSIDDVKNNDFIKWSRILDQNNDEFANKLGFLKDFDSPELDLSYSDGETILLEPNAESGSVEISGKTEKDAKLTVEFTLDGKQQKIDIKVEDDGSFKTPVLATPLGSVQFEFTAEDKVGNKTTETLRLYFQKKSASITPGISAFDNGSSGTSASLAWDLTGGLTADDGYKVVYGTDPNPAYNDGKSLVESTSLQSITVSGLDPLTTYKFAVCKYTSETDTCAYYSYVTITTE